MIVLLILKRMQLYQNNENTNFACTHFCGKCIVFILGQSLRILRNLATYQKTSHFVRVQGDKTMLPPNTNDKIKYARAKTFAKNLEF